MRNFLLIAGALLSLVLIGRILQLRDLLLSQSLTFWEIISLFVYLSPFFLLLLIPIACMLSVFLTFLRMSTDREILALKAGGISLYRLIPSPLIFCLFCTAIDLPIGLYGVSWGMEHFRETVVTLARTKAKLVLRPGVFNNDFPGLTIYAEKVDIAGGEMSTVFVRDKTRTEQSVTIIAPEGRIESDSKRGRIHFLLENGHVYLREKGGLNVLSFSEYLVGLDLSKVFKGVDLGEVRPKEMSWEKLAEIESDPAIRAKDNGLFARKVVVEIHNRFSLPAACLVLGLLALPLAAAFQGMSGHWGLILAMVIFFIYYTLYSLGVSFGETGLLNPAIGLWLPNVSLFFLAVIGFKLAAEEKTINIFELIRHARDSRRTAGNVRKV